MGNHSLPRWRMPVLFLLSLGVLGYLMVLHPPQLHASLGQLPQGPGRGAGGTAASTHVPAQPDVCWPTDINCLVNSVSSVIAQGIQSIFQPLADGVLKNPADILYQTPILTNDNASLNRPILTLNTFFVGIVDLAFVALLVIGGLNVIVGRHLSLPYATIAEVLPRAVLVMLAVHFNVQFLGLFIDFENALTIGVIHIAGLNMLTNLIGGFLTMRFGTLSILSFLLVVVLGIMSVMLLIQMVVRFALVALSLVLAPLGLGCFFLPQTLRWARLWLVMLSTSVMVQFVQVVALGVGGVFVSALASAAFLRLDKNLTILFLAIGVLGLVLKIPGMLQTWALHPMMANSAGTGSASTTDSTYPTPRVSVGEASASGGSSGGGWTTVTETNSGGMMEGSMLAGEGGELLLLF